MKFFLLLALVPFVFGYNTLYCPSTNDLIIAYQDNAGINGTVTLNNQGWNISGAGGAATKSSFNILGGYISYTVNFDQTPVGINANVYIITPSFSGSFAKVPSYCDGNNANWCVEIDFIETNGNCGGATTIHTVPGTGASPNCNGWGCATLYNYSGTGASFNMNISFDASGHMTTVRGGQVIGAPNQLPQALDLTNLINAQKTNGSVVYSSQWVGWVPPAPGCNTTNGNLTIAKMSVSNLEIYGTVVNGPTPTKCAYQPPTPTPTSTSTPTSTPTPSGRGSTASVHSSSSLLLIICMIISSALVFF